MPFDKIVAQCYDGAANMTDRHKGLKTRVLKDNPRALFTHCYNHQLNLALEDTCSHITMIRNTVGTSKMIHNFIKTSASRYNIFKTFQKENNSVLNEEDKVSSSIKLLCGTRWASRDKAFHSISSNFKTIYESLKVDHC